MALSQMMMVPKNNDFVSSFGVFFSSFLRHWPSAAKTKIFALGEEARVGLWI